MNAKRDSEAIQTRLDEMLEAVDSALLEGDFAGAHAELTRASALAGDDHPEVLFATACVAWDERGPSHAIALLQRVVSAEPAHSDAHHALACAFEERGARGDEKSAIEHFLHVHRLDARSDREARIGTRRELDHIERVAREVLDGLPAPFAQRLAHVPVVLERRPSRDLVADGFDPRAGIAGLRTLIFDL